MRRQSKYKRHFIFGRVNELDVEKEDHYISVVTFFRLLDEALFIPSLKGGFPSLDDFRLDEETFFLPLSLDLDSELLAEELDDFRLDEVFFFFLFVDPESELLLVDDLRLSEPDLSFSVLDLLFFEPDRFFFEPFELDLLLSEPDFVLSDSSLVFTGMIGFFIPFGVGLPTIFSLSAEDVLFTLTLPLLFGDDEYGANVDLGDWLTSVPLFERFGSPVSA